MIHWDDARHLEPPDDLPVPYVDWDEQEDWDTAPLRPTLRAVGAEWDDWSDPSADYRLGRLTLEVDAHDYGGNASCAGCGHARMYHFKTYPDQPKCQMTVAKGYTEPWIAMLPGNRRGCRCTGFAAATRTVPYDELAKDAERSNPKYDREANR